MTIRSYDRQESLRRLMLNRIEDRSGLAESPQVVTHLAGPVERGQPERFAANNLWQTRLRSLGDRPVLPIEPLRGGIFAREISNTPAWAAQAIANWPILYKGHYLGITDFDDFSIGSYGSTPIFDRAVDSIIEAGVRLDIPSPAREANLSEVAKLILDAIRRHMDPRFLGNGDPRVMREKRSSLYFSAASHIANRAACFTTFSRDAMLEAHGAAGAQLFDAWSAAMPQYRGLQKVLLRAQLPMEPTYGIIPPTREEIEATAKRDPRLLDRMVELAEIPDHLPMIDAAEQLIPDGAFAGVHAVCIQHVLGSQIANFEAMKRKGLDPAKTEIIGVPYSTSYVAEHALRMRGFKVDTPFIIDPNDVGPAVEKAAVAALARAIERSKLDGKPILVLDDGGKASLAIHKHFPHEAHRFRLVEQTTRGITELKSLPAILLRAIDVAKSWMKQHESLKIGEEIAGNIEMLLDRISMAPLEGREVGIIGFGMIGSGAAARMRGRNAKVTVWDIDPAKRAEAERLGFKVARSREELLGGKHVIVGCTGHRVIGREDLQYLSHETVLASASSRDIEFDLSPNRDRQVEVVPLLAEGPGDTRFTTRVWRFEDKDLVVLRNGFPVNFNGAIETSSYESIQQTRAIMLLGAAQAVASAAIGLEALSVERQNELARACGIPIPAG